MVQCCPLGGLRYINDDGSIDRESLDKQAQELAKDMRETGYDLDADGVLIAAENPCTCFCHKKNNQAIH